MNPAPRVTVIIPAYNAGTFLFRTITSVLEQTILPAEIIVIDDGSKDETVQIALGFGGIVKCLSTANGGPASARNYGIRVATGDWIAFLDADDQWRPDKLEKQLQLIAETDADLVSSDAFLVRGSHSETTWLRHTGIWPRLEPFVGARILPNPFEMLLRIGCFLLPSMVIVKKNCLTGVGLFDEVMHGTEDIDLWLRLSLHCKIAIHPNALIERQIHENNITGNPVRMVAEKIKVWEKIQSLDEIKNNPVWTNLINKRKAEDYWHQGYWLLNCHRRKEARESWRKSLTASFSLCVALHWILTAPPDSLVYGMRHALHRVRPAQGPLENGNKDSLAVR